jgi:L-2-amino-thiazoline-4-carboxylic acid hydrolase
MSGHLNYYTLRKSLYLLQFNLVASSALPAISKAFDGDDPRALVTEARREFSTLIPLLPYIGGKQPFTEFIVFTGMLLALYRVAKTHGKTVEQTGELVYGIGINFLGSYPAILKLLFGKVNFSRTHQYQLQKGAVQSHLRQYPDNYVFNFIEGDGGRFDYGVDYLECASCKLLTKHGALELAPYLCPVDILYSQVLDWGLMRTQTLAEGASRCDFRFKKGGPTKVAVPVSMRSVVAQDMQP